MCCQGYNNFEKSAVKLEKLNGIAVPHDKDYEEFVQSLAFPCIAVAFQLDSTSIQYSVKRIAKSMLTLLRDIFSIPKEFFWHFEKDSCYICLLPLCDVTKDDDSVKSRIFPGLEQARTQLEYQNGISASIGCGTIIEDISQISRSVYQAVCAIESLHLCGRFNEVRFYQDMGVYRIFFQCQNDQELLRIYHTILGKLSSYDAQNNSQFLDTLEIYLRNNGNLTATAEALFIHKNTLKYRLNRIKEILGIDFDQPNPGFTVQLAFKIKRYLISRGIAV